MKKIVSGMIGALMIMSTGVCAAQVELENDLLDNVTVRTADFVEAISQTAGARGATVIEKDGSVSVQKGGKSMAVIDNRAYWMDGTKLMSEDITYNGYFVKVPKKALTSVLGRDARKGEEYENAMNNIASHVVRIGGSLDTEYGTLVETYAAGVMRAFSNVLTFVKWDGTTVAVTSRAPYHNPYSYARWSRLDLSEDGKILTVVYPTNDKKLEYVLYGDEKRVLWEEGTYIITVNLETGESELEIVPTGK